MKRETRNIKIQIRVGTDSVLPQNLKQYKAYGYGVINPITVIDKKIVWYGLPAGGAGFKVRSGEVDTKYKPIVKWIGKNTANAIIVFLKY